MSRELLLCSDTEERLEKQIETVGKERLHASSEVFKSIITTDLATQELFCQRFIVTGADKW